MPGGAADPVRKRRAIKRDPLPGVDLRLTIKRKMVGVFGDEHMRNGRLRRHAAFNQSILSIADQSQRAQSRSPIDMMRQG